MARHRGAKIARAVRPDRVAGALANDLTAVLGQVSLEFLASQAAARSIVTCSAWPPPIGGSRPSSRYEAIISRAASSSSSRASSTVRPQVTTAGHSASCAIVQPFSSGVKTAVRVSVSGTGSVCPREVVLSGPAGRSPGGWLPRFFRCSCCSPSRRRATSAAGFGVRASLLGTGATDCICLLLRGRALAREDRVPGGGVVGVEPALDLPSIAIPKDADHAGVRIDAVAASAHRADSADVTVACKHVVLDKPESKSLELRQPGKNCIAPSNGSRHRVLAGNVPYDLGRDHALDPVQIPGSEGISSTPVRESVGVFLRHRETLARASSRNCETVSGVHPHSGPADAPTPAARREGAGSCRQAERGGTRRSDRYRPPRPRQLGAPTPTTSRRAPPPPPVQE